MSGKISSIPGLLFIFYMVISSGFRLPLHYSGSFSSKDDYYSAFTRAHSSSLIMQADSPKKWMMKNLLGGMALLPLFLNGPLPARADDELAKFAAEGNKVGVDGTCFFRKCALETASCGNDPSCLKGLSCLAR